MNKARLHRLIAAGVFLYALVLYGFTMARTTSLWDAGEFIASAYGLQVMHPPGAPVYMLLGRLFSMLVPASYVALAVNLVSVLASAATVLLTYLILVKLIAWWHRGEDQGSKTSAFWIAVGGGLVGACTFAATDSFWFNAVEAEVYALSMFFTAVAVWISLIWSERAQQGHHEDRYLVLIAFLFGLAIGVHLMAVLTFFFIALIYFFTRIDKPAWTWKQRLPYLLGAGVASLVAFVVIYPGVVIVLPEWAEQSGAPLLFLAGVAVLLLGGLVVTHRRGFAGMNLALLCLVGVLIGTSSYALIPIRSTANPPIDLNDPETTEALVPYLKRDQYGQRDLLYGGTYDDRSGQVDAKSNESFLPRRNSWDPNHWRLYARYASDGDYFFRYQLGHMYTRYFLWNFAGKAKDEQGAGWAPGFSPQETDTYVYTTPSEQASRNRYFALPLLLGLLGMVYHFRRDWRRALSVGVLFFITGVGLVIYLNEIPQTPRERDYIYVASYFAFALWIGIGAAGLLERFWHLDFGLRIKWLNSKVQNLRPKMALVLGVLLFALVPFWMLIQNYDDHDRSGRYFARDFAYNLLMSLEENAVLFTEGDNDTYPLWYLQEVEGVRRDVRVVCLSLLNTAWSARQLRDQWSYEAAPLPISLTDEQLDQLQFMAWEPRELQLPVEPSLLVEETEMQISVEDTSGFDSPMTWTLEGRPYGEGINVLHPVDQIVYDILATNARQGWQRPVYFAATTAGASQLDLQPYFQLEGLAYRVVPIRHEERNGRVVPEIMLDRLAQFKFTQLDDPDVYFGPWSRGLAGNAYRNVFSTTAEKLLREGRPQEARQMLEIVLEAVPPDTIPINFFEAYPMAQAYEVLGEDQRSADLLRYTEPYVLRDVARADTTQRLELAVRQAQEIQRYYVRARDFDGAAALGNRLADLLQDDGFRVAPEMLEELYEEMQRQEPSNAGRG